MAKIKGRDIHVFLNGAAVGLSTVCELDVTCDVREVTGFLTSQWKEYLAGRKGWKVTVNFLVGLESDLLTLLGSTVALNFALSETPVQGKSSATRTVDNRFKMSGNAICTRNTISAKNGDWVSGSFEFLGTGALS